MKKKKNKMKKRISLLIATILAAGIAVPPLVNYVTDVRAEDIAPSLQYYAESDGLRQLAATPGSVQLRFGKTPDGSPANWYILGTQDSGNNIELFSAQSFGKSAYQSTAADTNGLISFDAVNNRDVDYDLESNIPTDPDVEDKEIESVYANHYGVSTLRTTLKGYMPQCFSGLDSLMVRRMFTLKDEYNTIPVADPDGVGDKKTYLFSDQLYAPEEDELEGKIGAQVGPLWTGTTVDGSATQAYTYRTEPQADGTTTNWYKEAAEVTVENEIWPAFTLDLSQDKESGLEVLFASVVPTGPAAVSGGSAAVINAGNSDYDTMKLRVDGSKGTYAGVELAYNESAITYKGVPRGSKLVIQGKHNETSQDWYYSAAIENNGIIESKDITGMITGQLNIPGGTNVSFENCEIWVETATAATGDVTYALKGREGIVDNIELSLSAPKPGERFESYAQCNTWGITQTNPNGLNVVWSDAATGNLIGNGTAEFGTVYRASITVTLETGYTYADNLTATLEGAKLIDINVDTRDPNIRTLIFEFETEADTEIKYEVYYDKDLVENPASGIKRDYDGKNNHSIEIFVTDPKIASVQYSVDGGITWVNWVPVEIGDAGEYIIDYKIESPGYDAVNSADNPNDEWDPLVITIEPREIRITPRAQDILWGYEIAQGKDYYDVVNVRDPDEDALLSGHRIKGLTLTASEGAKVNSDGIICYGYIYFNSKGDNGEDLITIVDSNNSDKDVTKNYVVIGGSPGELIVRHNENLPPESITVEKAKTTYTLGEALLVNDLKITARYGDGYTELVPRGGGHDSVTTNEEDIDMTTLGGKTLTVTYTREEPEEARGSASSTLTLNVVEEDIPNVDPSPGDDDNNNNDNNNNNNDNNNNNGNDGNSGNNNSGSNNNGSQNNGSTTNPGTTTRSATDPTTTSSTGTTGSTTNTTGTSSKNATASGARTGDTNPIAIWVLTALCSGIVVVSLMIFNINKGSRKRRSKR